MSTFIASRTWQEIRQHTVGSTGQNLRHSSGLIVQQRVCPFHRQTLGAAARTGRPFCGARRMKQAQRVHVSVAP